MTPDELVAAAGLVADGMIAGGQLRVAGTGRAEFDARHVVVEYMHPVTVGKRALPARLGLDRARPEDVTMSIAYGGDRPADAAIVLSDRAPATDADDRAWVRLREHDQCAAKVDAVLAYHVLWELTHVFLDAEDPGETPSAAFDLYPMLGGGGGRPRAADDARRSAQAKLAESADVRATAVRDNRSGVERAAAIVAEARTVFAFGNGGSSTDASHAAASIGATARCLCDDVATITALANDVSFDVVFARQLATLGARGDCMIAFSTSGNSPNLIEAARVARRIGMSTIGFAGYDGGAMARSGAFDVVLVVRSESVHRIQEAHAELTGLLHVG